jgi:hypothetical protein
VHPVPLWLDSCGKPSITKESAGCTIEINTPCSFSRVGQASSSFHPSGLTSGRSEARAERMAPTEERT